MDSDRTDAAPAAAAAFVCSGCGGTAQARKPLCLECELASNARQLAATVRLPQEGSPVDATRLPTLPSEPFQFSLQNLFLFVTWLAIGLAIFMQTLAWGVIFVAASVGGWMHLWFCGKRAEERAATLTNRERKFAVARGMAIVGAGTVVVCAVLAGTIDLLLDDEIGSELFIPLMVCAAVSAMLVFNIIEAACTAATRQGRPWRILEFYALVDGEPGHRCFSCGAPIEDPGRRCLMCELAAASREARKLQPYAKDAPEPARPAPLTFGLLTLMLLVTTAAISFAIGARVPMLGMLFALLFVPATVRTSLLSERARSAGRPLTRLEQRTIFVTTLAICTLLTPFLMLLGPRPWR